MIGARAAVSNLGEGSTESDAISALYASTVEQLARTAPWNCLKKQANLTLLAAAQGTPENPDGTTTPIPPTPWLYSYALPSDCLQIRYILPPFTNTTPTGSVPMTTVNMGGSLWIPNAGQIRYSVAYDTDENNNPRTIVLTNCTQAQAVYTVNQSNPVIFDSLFEQALVASLAAYLVPALSLDLSLMDRVVRIANEAISLARVRDGNEGVVSQNRNASWMDARVTGGSLAWSSDYGGNLYNDMIWPGA
jgi:hypothetical protein